MLNTFLGRLYYSSNRGITCYVHKTCLKSIEISRARWKYIGNNTRCFNTNYAILYSWPKVRYNTRNLARVKWNTYTIGLHNILVHDNGEYDLYSLLYLYIMYSLHSLYIYVVSCPKILYNRRVLSVHNILFGACLSAVNRSFPYWCPYTHTMHYEIYYCNFKNFSMITSETVITLDYNNALHDEK